MSSEELDKELAAFFEHVKDFLREHGMKPSPPRVLATDSVEHPSHYNQGKIEVWDFVVDQNLGYCPGNVVNYICRAKHKGKELEDLKKARQYLDREIERVEYWLGKTSYGSGTAADTKEVSKAILRSDEDPAY